MSLVFAVGDQAILPGTAEHPSPCPQLGKHFDHGLQQEGPDKLYDQHFDFDDPSVNGNLFDLYSKLGITEHEMRDDVYDSVVDSTIVGSLPVSSCCSLVKSCTQGPVHVKGRLKNHLGFWQRIKANQWVISAISEFWKVSFHHCNGRPIRDAYLEINVTSYSNASDTGWGGYCVNVAGTEVSGSWSDTESKESSTWKELRGIRLVLLSVAEKLSGKRYATGLTTSTRRTSSRWEAHAQNCMPRLSQSTLCGQYSICLEPEWILRN